MFPTLVSISMLLGVSSAALWPSQTFKSVDFLPPVFEITKSGAPLADGLIFLTPALENINTTSLPGIIGSIGSLQATTTIIINDDGQLVWQGPTSTVLEFIAELGNANITTNLVVQELDGEPILTHWIGYGSDVGRGYGSVAIYDTTYKQIYTICPDLDVVYNTATITASLDCFVDLHESYVTPRGSIIVSVANITEFDLSPIGGPVDGYVYDSQFHEVDIKTNEILFSWSSVKSGIPITYTKLTPCEGTSGCGTKDDPFDWFHVNAVSSTGPEYLVNSRHCWTTWMLDSNGTIQWKIEGNNTEGQSDFVLPEDGHFEWQHDARYTNLTNSSIVLTYFNNYNSAFSNGTAPSNGLQLTLDLTDKTVTVDKQLVDPNNSIYTESQGASNILSNGNTFTGWGSIAQLNEFGPDGNEDVRLTMKFGYENLVQSYRAYRQVWNATPTAAPDVVAHNRSAYMSWNGATDHTAWKVYAGLQANKLQYVGTVERNNMFETSYPLPATALFLQVAAYQGDTWLRNSSVVFTPLNISGGVAANTTTTNATAAMVSELGATKTGAQSLSNLGNTRRGMTMV